MKFYYLRTGLQVRDAFFGNRQRIYTCSASITDWYPGKVLLEAERRYTSELAQHGVDKLSLFCGWHSSLQNQNYHYTLRGYNRRGWMALTLEMEAGNQGQVYAYGRRDWKRWSWKARANGQGKPGRNLFFNTSDHVEAGYTCNISIAFRNSRDRWRWKWILKSDDHGVVFTPYMSLVSCTFFWDTIFGAENKINGEGSYHFMLW
ncbi:hypothetical protein EDD18DRAFT_1109603 [Armillaria luteobubalina]|uniref:Uncharacterized protein n=1 Tax=Armillaria luteobubalina TaxID=153913 RepID=A0AA39UPK4_9AGAR|nr:hypothetical protein EDD18DRAFT_1109603 [Armillaria luteobubalina]